MRLQEHQYNPHPDHELFTVGHIEVVEKALLGDMDVMRFRLEAVKEATEQLQELLYIRWEDR